MLQNPRKTLGFKKNMVYKIPPGGGGKPYPASGLPACVPKFKAENILSSISHKFSCISECYISIGKLLTVIFFLSSALFIIKACFFVFSIYIYKICM